MVKCSMPVSGRLLGFLIWPAVFVLAGYAYPAQQPSVSQGSVTWHFSASCEVGQFASGDWWVLAPVTITRIEPDFANGYNGWEVDPVANVAEQGFDQELAGYTAGKVPALPYAISSGTVSVIKAVSSAPGEVRRIASARILTVVSSVPAGNGAGLFRPPYVGTAKPFYQVTDINWSLLPSYTSSVISPALVPALATVAANFTNPNLAHTTTVRYMRPVDAVPDDYQPANCPSINEAVLRLMLDDSQAAKEAALIKVLQRGIDKIHWQLAGNVQPNSGHMPCLITIPAFTAAMLDITVYKTFMKNLTATGDRQNFQEFQYIRASDRDSTLVLWGQDNSETNYWNYVTTGSGNRSNQDPYRYIDGGTCGAAYQLITINGHKGEILSALLMPAVGMVFEPGLYRRMVTYVDRMIDHGVWAQPDPCAPVDQDGGPGQPAGTCVRDPDLAYYYGPDDFACQAGAQCGRFPDNHGARSGWQYNSNFVNAMWNAYRASAAGIVRPARSIGGRGSGLEPTIRHNPLSRGSQSMVFDIVTGGNRLIRAGIFTLEGKAVKEFAPAVGTTLVWDGKDNRGRRAAAGVYYVEIEASSGTIGKNFLVIN